MRYYNIGHTNDIEVIGFYPQTTRTSKEGYHVDSFNSELKVHFDNFPNFAPNYALDLAPKAIETDFLDRGSLDFGFIVSDRLKELLKEFKLPPHRFYPIKVYDSHSQYFWFHYISNIEKYLDYQNTEIEIYINRPPFDIDSTKRFSSQSDIMLFKKSMPYNKSMRFKEIHLNEDFPNYDLFEITGAQYFTLISERLKERLEQGKVTGYETIEYEKIKN